MGLDVNDAALGRATLEYETFTPGQPRRPNGSDSKVEQLLERMPPRKTNGTGAGHAEPAQPSRPRPITLAEWAAAEFPDPVYLLGAVHGLDTRSMLVADTGLGKTMLSMAMAVAVYLGRDFLHWKCPTPGVRRRVMYVDGEMPAALCKRRLKIALSWFGENYADQKDGFYVISRDVLDDMPPLDTPAGQQWLGAIIDERRPDFSVFDNLMCLTEGSLKEDASWLALKPWLLHLPCGWLLVHHTGTDTTRGYGDKSREWGLDAVMILERIACAQDCRESVRFSIRFPKCRRREPDNWQDFGKRQITLEDGQWSVSSDATEQAATLSATDRAIFAAIRRQWPGNFSVTLSRTETSEIIKPLVADDLLAKLSAERSRERKTALQTNIRSRVMRAVKQLIEKGFVKEQGAKMLSIALPIEQDLSDFGKD